jgi:hypothetical protein
MEQHRHDAGQGTDPNQCDQKKAASEELEAGGGAGKKRVVNRGHGVATVNRGVVAIQHVTFNASPQALVPTEECATFSPLYGIGSGDDPN